MAWHSRRWRVSGGMRIQVGATVATTFALLICSPALAKLPTGDFAGFSRCPRFDAGVNLCLLAQITSGEVRVGKMTVPIDRTLILQGGIIRQEPSETFVAALGGETLSRAPLAIPGGLTGILAVNRLSAPVQRLLSNATGKGGTTVTATPELVGVPLLDTPNLENKEGVGLSLPVRVKLDNQFLGQQCYVGSSKSPLTLGFTTGRTSPPKPNMPIAGRFGRLTEKDEFNLIEVHGDSLVDNSFAAPRASGCGGPLSEVIDNAINAKLDLPSPAGSNTAVFNDTILEATSEGVIESET